MESSPKNTYMEEVLQQQQAVQQELKRKTAPSESAPRQRMVQAPQAEPGRSIDVRITGFWRFKTVIVPPNVWVVHTRRGYDKPLRVGLGTSFRYNDLTDTFIVAPATMQTLAINARCIGKERQGIMVQAYVQWIINDFAAAYQKFDFSDVDDPMRIVNIQLREQAEASIKDKVATLTIDDVLADKQPIIDELTTRLRQVAEGQGLKIVTVQIKEAVISSTRLFENLQKPFREEQQRIARMAEIARERQIHDAQHKAQVDAFELQRLEQRRRAQLEEKAAQERALEHAETERIKKASEVELQGQLAKLEEARVAAELARIAAQRQIVDAEQKAIHALAELTIARERLEAEAKAVKERLAIELLGLRRKIDNDVSDARVSELLIERLPQLVANLPKPEKLESVHISGDGSMPEAVGAITGIVKGLRSALAKAP